MNSVKVADAARRKPPQVTLESTVRMTTLRAGPPTFLASGRMGMREVRYTSVRVSNLSDVTAKEVQVVLVLESGLTLPLRGPKRIGPYASAFYVSSTKVPSSATLHPRAIITCATCRR